MKKFIAFATAVLIGLSFTFAADKMGVFTNFISAIIFAMSVAVVKASAVIYIFMHLKWDIKLKTISLTLGCTVIFFIGMMYLTVESEIDSNKPGHELIHRFLIERSVRIDLLENATIKNRNTSPQGHCLNLVVSHINHSSIQLIM